MCPLKVTKKYKVVPKQHCCHNATRTQPLVPLLLFYIQVFKQRNGVANFLTLNLLLKSQLFCYPLPPHDSCNCIRPIL